MATGFAAGLVASGGDLRAGLVGALAAGAFYGIGQHFKTFTNCQYAGRLTAGQLVQKAVSHGLVGGLSSVANGGRFQHGFLSAGASTAMTPYSARVPGGYLGQISAAAVVGGTVSELGGGKFANGASTAAFLATTVAAADYYRDKVGYDADIVPGTEYVRGADGNIIRYEGVRPPGPEYDVSGFNRNIEGHWMHPRNAFKQGGIVGRLVNYLLPFGKATSHLHDTWLNVNPSLSNTGTMLPAYAISVAAVPGVAFRGWESNPMAWHYISPAATASR